MKISWGHIWILRFSVSILTSYSVLVLSNSAAKSVHPLIWLSLVSNFVFWVSKKLFVLSNFTRAADNSLKKIKLYNFQTLWQISSFSGTYKNFKMEDKFLKNLEDRFDSFLSQPFVLILLWRNVFDVWRFLNRLNLKNYLFTPVDSKFFDTTGTVGDLKNVPDSWAKNWHTQLSPL